MKKQIKIAVIPAAGMGSRIAQLPLTKILPKPMLPLMNKPILEYIINWLVKAGIKKIYLIVNFKKNIIKEYFVDGDDFGVEIKYINQPSLGDKERGWGLADVIYLLKRKIHQPFIVVLGDDFTITKNPQMIINSFFDKQAIALETIVNEKDSEVLKRTCCVKLGEYNKILDIEEKPQQPKWGLRGCGIYIFDPLVFSFIEKTPLENGKRDITKTIQIMAKETGRVYGFLVEKNININTLKDLNQATLTVLQRK